MEKLNFGSRVMLRNGVKMPVLGFGTAEIASTVEEQTAIIREAIDVGYRLLDTAYMYYTERAVGKAVKESGIDREEFFISTKLSTYDARMGRKAMILQFEESLRRLDMDYVDCLILHWPVQGQLSETWKFMEELYYAGKTRAIGLSNVRRHHLLEVLHTCEEVPHIEQDTYNPIARNLYTKLFAEDNGIQYEAFLPIIRGAVNQIPEIKQIAEVHGKNPIQVVLRWDLQSNCITIPRTSNKQHMISNADIFDFSLTEEEMQIINSLNREEETNCDTFNFNF